MNIAKNLQRLMEQSNISPERLAHDLSLPKETINAWLEGTQTPSMEQLNILKRCFSVTLDKLCADVPTNEIPSERYVLPYEEEDSIQSINAYIKQVRRPSIVGLITIAPLFAISLCFEVSSSCRFVYGIFTFLFVYNLIRYTISRNRIIESVVNIPKDQWKVFTFTKDIFRYEKWNSAGIMEESAYKKEDLSALYEDHDGYSFVITTRLYRIRKNLLTADSLVHSFLAEKKAENLKHPPFLDSLKMVLLGLSLGTLLLSNYVIGYFLYHSPVLLILCAALCILLPVSSFIVSLLTRRKGEKIATCIIFHAAFLFANICFMLSF